MSVLVWLLILMMMRMMKSEEIITAHSGEAVLLTSDLQGAELDQRWDVRWTHSQLVMSLKSNVTTCHDGRCELLRNGSLRFSRVQATDSGSYSLQVFDERGKILKKRNFLLRVEDTSSGSSSSSSVLVSVLTCCFLLLLLLFFIIFFILRRRRSQRTCMAADSLQENVYVVMHGHRGNKRKEEEKQEKEEESHYVPCIPVVSMETPITQQMSEDVEDIYV